jgi:hypothetical protein
VEGCNVILVSCFSGHERGPKEREVGGSTTPWASSGAFLAGKKIKLSNIFYIKETVQVVPENIHKTHCVNPSSVTSVSSVGTMVMFLSLD